MYEWYNDSVLLFTIQTTVLERLRKLPFEEILQWDAPFKVWTYYCRTVLFPNNQDERTVLSPYSKEDEGGGKPISFRVTCARSGRQHVFSSNEAAGSLGAGLEARFGWTVDLKDADMEVLLRISGDDVELGLALNRESKFKRNISHVGRTTLHSNIAYALLR